MHRAVRGPERLQEAKGHITKRWVLLGHECHIMAKHRKVQSPVGEQ